MWLVIHTELCICSLISTNRNKVKEYLSTLIKFFLMKRKCWLSTKRPNLINVLCILVLCILCLLCDLNGHTENLLPNGSFEVTTLRDMPDVWDQVFGPKKIPKWYDLWKLDTQNSVSGYKSLCITVPTNEMCGKIYAESFFTDRLIRIAKLPKLIRGRFYTLTIYMKSNRINMPVKVTFQVQETVKVNLQWQRYSFTKFLKSDDKLRRIRITPLSVGKLWIDAVQLEMGNRATPFRPSTFDERFVKTPLPDTVGAVKRKLAIFGRQTDKYEYRGNVTRQQVSKKDIETNESRVTVDPSRQIILVNRKPFFFFAACFLRAHLYEDRWNELLEHLRTHGYSVVIPSFGCTECRRAASIGQILRFFDVAHEKGLMVIPWIIPPAIRNMHGQFKRVPRNFPPNIVLREYEKEIQRIVPALKHHPSLLAWYVYDEPSKLELIRSGFTSKLVRFTKTLDNLHPVYVNYGNLLAEYLFYGGHVPGDIVSMTQYPIPLSSVTQIAEKTDLESVAANSEKPVVLWLQMWGGKGRYPTPAEFSCMTYLAAIYGATGFQTWPMMPGSKTLWDHVKRVISEMRELFPVLSEPHEVPIEVKGSNYIHAMAKKVDNKYWIVAVNTLDRTQMPKIYLPQLSNVKEVNVMFENRICPLRINSIIDRFEPYERHVYVFEPSGNYASSQGAHNE